MTRVESEEVSEDKVNPWTSKSDSFFDSLMVVTEHTIPGWRSADGGFKKEASQGNLEDEED